MKPIVAAAVIASLFAGLLPASADRRSKRRVVAEEDEEVVDQDGPEARAAVTVKLDDLIEVAVRMSPALARSKNDRLAAKGQAKAARASQQWGVQLKASMERFAIGPEIEVGPFQVVASNKLLASLGVFRNLPTGGRFETEIGVQREAKEFEIPSVLDAALAAQAAAQGLDDGTKINDNSLLHQASATLRFTQPLARGFGPDAALAEQRKADYQAAEATVKTQFEAEVMVRDVVKAYWDLAFAHFDVKTRLEALALARKQEEITRVEFRGQLKPEAELNTVLHEVALREEALLVAKDQLEKKSLALRKQVGLELDRRDIVIRTVDPFEVDNTEWDIEDVLAASRKGNRQVAALILAKRAAEVDVKATRNAMLPKVDVNVSGTVFGSGNDANAALSDTAAGVGYQVTGGLTVQFDLGGAARGAHDAARARRQRIEIDQLDTARTIEAEVVAAVHAVKSAQARAGYADRAAQYAELNVKAERATYQAGKGDNFRVMQRQTELVEARLRRGRAIADYHIAVAEVQFLGGMLLEQYRVRVRPPTRR